MTPATGGFATSVWRVPYRGRAFALRVFRADQHAVQEREVVAMRAAALRVPVPRVHAIGTYDARPAVLLDWCAGKPIISQPWLGVAFGRLHRRLHTVRAPAGLRSTWLDWPRPADPAVVERLSGIALKTDRLLHLDFHPLNVLGDGHQLTAVLDWTNVHAGDPRADFARTVTILRLSPPWGDRKQHLGRVLFEMLWRLGYGPPGSDMAAFYAWAGGAMQHDLAGRYSADELAHVRRWTAQWLR